MPMKTLQARVLFSQDNLLGIKTETSRVFQYQNCPLDIHLSKKANDAIGDEDNGWHIIYSDRFHSFLITRC